MQPAPDLHPVEPAGPPRERFDYRGRRYTLFKRSVHDSAPWYIHLQHGGQRFKKCLDANVRRLALMHAKAFIDSVVEERWDDVRSLRARTVVSSVAQLAAVYREKSTAGRNTKRNNLWALDYILKTVGIDPTTAKLSVLTEDLAFRFQEALLTRYAAAAAKDDASQREARDRSLRSSRSLLRQARSLFNRSSEILRHYAAAGLTLPSLDGFMQSKVRGKATKREYLAPPDSVVTAAFDHIALVRDKQPDVFKSFWLAAGAGLRKSEIQRLDWTHFIQRGGELWISGGIGKNGERIEVQVQSRAAQELAQFRQPAGRVIHTGGDKWARALNYWMSQQGWQTEKKMHELRAYVGSLIYQINPVSAMKFMRHHSIKVTEQFYCRYSVQMKPVDVL